MAQTYTLEESAERLGIGTDDFKRRLKDEWKSIRSFRDGATMRFRAADIDELARSLGEASDPGLQLSEPLNTHPEASSDEFVMPNDMMQSVASDDLFAMPTGDSGKSKKPKDGSDSDVRIELDSGKPKKDPGSLTEEISLDLSGPSSGVLRSGGSSQRLKAPKSGPNLAGPKSSTRIPGPPESQDLSNTDSSSEFELNLDSDSDSFELQLNDNSEEIDLGGSTESAKPKGNQSGINLGKPADSGVSLEGLGLIDEDSDDYELSLDSDVTKNTPPKSTRVPPAQSTNDSDSEFELTLDDGSGSMDELAGSFQAEDENKGDIFETDFDVPVISDDADSGSEVVAVESSDTDLENSDFDLALDESDINADDESASQVVLVDDEPSADYADEDGGMGRAAGLAGAAALAGGAARRKRKPVDLDDDELGADVLDDEQSSVSGALRGVSRGSTDDDDLPGRVAPPAPWGPIPAIVLLPCLLLTFLGAITSFELMKGMWGYHSGSKPTGGLVREIAKALDMDPKD